ncbi:MAG: Ldh family oxidoreductase [Acidothermaceae bacterium]
MTTVAEVRSLCIELLQAAGVPSEPAYRTATALVLAEMWGLPSHGLLRLPHYLRRIAAGGINPRAELTVASAHGATVALDGNAGLGHWQLWDAVGRASQLARIFGIGMVSVANSNHCGALGAGVIGALPDGHIGFAMSNGPAVMPPWHGRSPVLSTSPLAAAIPTSPAPTIIDMATSAVSRGAIAVYAEKDELLPEGWAVDRAGVPTSDPHSALAGMLMPMAGPKGYALALLVEALTGALVGPLLAVDVVDMFDRSHDAVPQGIAHVAFAIDPACLGVGGRDRLHRLANSIAEAGGRLPGANRVLPAELHDDAACPTSPATMREIRACAEHFGLDSVSG